MHKQIVSVKDLTAVAISPPDQCHAWKRAKLHRSNVKVRGMPTANCVPSRLIDWHFCAKSVDLSTRPQSFLNYISGKLNPVRFPMLFHLAICVKTRKQIN